MPDKKDTKQTFASKNAAKAQEKVKSIEEMMADTEGGKIWSEIKNKPVEMFGLPNQTVSTCSFPYPIEPSKLYLVVKASAALPAIETAVGAAYTVELMDKYVVVSRAVVPLTRK
jgi:hypothetical protein